jgi:two-component system, OmpR family, KDP operon response regulator KdpE
MRILIADDDPQILRALKVTLRARGYEIFTAGDGAEALEMAAQHHPDLVMLDLGMPRLDGVEVIQGLRGWTQVPVLVVSGRTDAADKVDALDAGADDYVTKPFAIDELLARIRALTRRVVAPDDEPIVTFGAVSVDFSAKQVLRRRGKRSESVRLTPTEWRILDLLVHSPDKLVTRETLLTQIWGPHHTKDTGYLRLYFALVTVLGMGYRFVPDSKPE